MYDTLEKFKELPQDLQNYMLKEMLPVINCINNHILSADEVYVMLEVLTPIIEHKCLLGDDLREYLQIRCR